MLNLKVVFLVYITMMLPLNALAFDPYGTNDLVESGPLDKIIDVERCDTNKINFPLALADVVDLALCNNPQTRSLWASARYQAALVGVSTAAYLPTLTATAAVSNNQTQPSGQSVITSLSQTANLSASYLLYDFGGRSASLESAKQLLLAVNFARDATLQSNYLLAVQAYYTLLSARASVESFKVDEVTAKESLSAALARYQAGVATPVDRLQAQTTLSQATLNRIRSEGDVKSAQGSLANIMGFDATQTFTLQAVSEQTPDPVAEKEIGRLIADARLKRPDLAAADAQLKAAEAQVDLSKASGRPSITLGAIAGISNPDIQSSSLGVTLSIPLFSGYRTTYQVRASQAQVESRIADRDRLSSQIALDVWKAYQSMLTNSQALRSADDLVTTATQSEKMISGRYKAGVGNILDTLTAQSSLANARQQRVSAFYNFLFSRFALAQAIGELDLTQINSKN